MAKPKPRPKDPGGMRFTERDKDTLQTIYEFEGLMSKRQIAEACFDGNQDTARKRLRTLFEHGYLRQPEEEEVHRVPVGEWIYWLDTLGLEAVAGLRGEDPLKADKAKREAPQWAKIEHDLTLNDFRLTVNHALALHPEITPGMWVNEKTITRWADEVTFVQPNGRKAEKRFSPDGFFMVRRPRKQRIDEEEVFAFLVEIDKGTHSNPAFADEKVYPGIAYLNSPVYEKRYGVRFGRFLVVTTGGKRLEHMLQQTARIRGGEVFYFTTFAQVKPETVLTDPIWLVAGKRDPIAIIPS